MNSISIRRHIGNILFSIIPSSLFPIKRPILKFMKIQIGGNAKINIGVKFYGPGPVTIGKDTWIGPNCMFYTSDNVGIHIGSKCDIAPEVSFVCGSHELGSSLRRAGAGCPTNIYIKDGTWIGVKSTVLSGTIGNGVVVGANSLVRSNVPDNSLVAGVPARIIKNFDDDK